MANISNFTALSKRVGTNKNLIDNPLTKTEQGIINRANTAQNKPVSTTPTTQPLVFKESTAAGVTPEPLFKDTVNPIQAKLDSAVQQPQQGQTYAQSQQQGLKQGTGSAAGMVDLGNGSFRPLNPGESFDAGGNLVTASAPVVSDADTAERLMRDEYAKAVENAKKQGITLPYTDYESYKAWAQKPAQNAIDYTAQQQGIAQSIESSDVANSLANIEAAKAGTTASLAQGREGVQSAGNVLARQQFTAEMDRQTQKIRLQQQSNQLQRTQNMELLKRAQEEGNVKLASAIQDRIASLEKEQKQLDIDAKNAATDALDMAIKQQELGAKEKQNATTALINTFEKMGAGMVNLSPEAITAMVEGTSVSPAAAIAWQAGEKLKAEAAKTKDEAEASYKLAQAEKLQAEIKNVGKTADVLTWEYYDKLPEAGKAGFRDLLAVSKGSQIVKGDDGTLYGYDSVNNTLKTLVQPGMEGDTPNFGATPSGSTPAVRNNNPGNLRKSSLATGTNNGFAVFPDLETGYKALTADIEAKKTGASKTGITGESTLAQFINVYAPAGDNNNPVAYANAIASNIGVPVTTKIKDIPTDTLAKEIIRHEDGNMFKAMYGGTENTAEKAADEIMKPYSTATITTYPAKQRDAITEILNKRKAAALSNGDDMAVIRASAGGKQVEGTGVEAFAKAKNVVSQLGNLETTVMGMDTGPIVGLFKSANPYDVDAVKLKAELQAIVPNLARGIYGEVGVLTDQDINNYIQTLPNARSTEDQKAALLTMTKKIIADSIANKAATYAELGYDVSGLARSIEKIAPVVKTNAPTYSLPEDNKHVNNL